MTERFCRDCQHYNDFGMLCVRGKTPNGHDKVTGSQEYKYKVLRFAMSERDSLWPWHCGKRGRHFVKANAQVERPDRVRSDE